MGFLKRIFGRSAWEEVDDGLEDVVPVWESPSPKPAPRPAPQPASSLAPGAGTVPLPKFQPRAQPASVGGGTVPPALPTTPAMPPMPRFQPGARPGTAVGGAVPPVPPAGPPAPKFYPGAPPGVVLESAAPPVPRATPPVPPQAIPAGPGLPDAQSTTGARETVIDTVGENDLDMPEEFRGCRVVEQTLPDGKVQVVYQGADGFSILEETASVLIDAYRQELATVTPKTPLGGLREGYASAAAQMTVEPRLVGAPAAVAKTTPLVEEVIDTLGHGDDLPPELRGASFVRRGGEFRYVTRDGTRLSKDMAEGIMERWDRDQQSRRSSPLPSLPPPSFVPRTAVPVPNSGAASFIRSTPSPGRVPSVTPALPGLATPQPSMPLGAAVSQSPAGVPVAPRGAESSFGSDGVPAAPLDAESARSPAKAGWASSPVLTPASGTPPASYEPAPASPQAPPELLLPDATLETVLDAPAVAAARHAAERLRSLVLGGSAGVGRLDVTLERLAQTCQAEIDRKRTKHRFENLIQLSEQARAVLVAAWQESRDRVSKEAARDLEQDMLVLGLFNPMTLRDIDLAEFITVFRLRRSERRREIVTGELSRRVLEEVPPALLQYLMTHTFVEHVVETTALSGSASEALRAVMLGRLKAALDAVTSEVMRRHGVWLPGLNERLLQRLQPIVDGALSLLA